LKKLLDDITEKKPTTSSAGAGEMNEVKREDNGTTLSSAGGAR
jgi:hypothetical protein